MLKISFWLKGLNDNKESLEYITIDNPRKVLEGKLIGMYDCEVYLPETEKKLHSIYADNPIEALFFASEFTKAYLQGLINRGYTISEVKNKEPWKLEKKDPIINLREKLDNKDITPEVKQKILSLLKENFGKIPHDKLDNI